MTYGTIVAQLCQDYDSNYQEVNKQLDKMGYNIGMRLIEDFLAKSGVGRCSNFRETADMIAKVGFKIFLNISPTVTNWTSDNNQFSLVFDENPLADFVELPDDGRAQDELWFSNILCGVLRGALEMVSRLGRELFRIVVLYATRAHILAYPFRFKCKSKRISLAMCCGVTILQRCGYLW